MQRIICLFVFLFFSVIIFSQATRSVTVTSKKPVAKTTVAKSVAPKILKDLRDSASYTAGIHIINKYRSQNIYNFNGDVVGKCVDDLQSNKQQLISDADANNAVTAYQAQLMANPKFAPKAADPGVVLNDIRDSASYAAGIYLINFFREFDITNFNGNIITKAITDLQTGKKPLLNDSLANTVAMRYQYKLQEIKNKTNIDAGKKFLAENKRKPNVKVTPSGLQYEVITMGRGKKPTRKDKVSCNYTGSFIDGTEFNNSYTMGGPVTFSVSGVIKGWTEALQMMPVGSKWKLYVPYTLAYGPGQYQTIPGGSALVFEIDLLSIIDK